MSGERKRLCIRTYEINRKSNEGESYGWIRIYIGQDGVL